MDINLDTISNKRIKYELLSLVGLPIPKKIETTLNSNVLCELITRENIDYKCKIVIYFRILFIHKISKLVKFIMCNEYPFRPPQVKIGEYNYIDILCTSKISYTEKCLCCSSLACKGNWHPQNKLSDLANEIDENLKFLLQPRFLFLVKNIIIEKVGTYVPIDIYLFPDSLCKIIQNKIFKN